MREELMESEEERQLRRRKRIEEMKRRKKRSELIQRRVIPCGAALAVILLAVGVFRGISGRGGENSGDQDDHAVDGEMISGEAGRYDTEAGIVVGSAARMQEISGRNQEGAGWEGQEEPYQEVYGPALPEGFGRFSFEAYATENTEGFGENVFSSYGILIDVDQGIILAQREAGSRMNPASMTKILTVLTAAEALGLNGPDWKSSPLLEEGLEITLDITDYCFVNGCSVVGFELGETVKVQDMFYGTILPSGADAALALAIYVAGSQEAFVDLMNKKLEDLGLSDTTHFTNCVGVYDENHYSTAYDMAVIMKAAVENEFCRDVLSTHIYDIAPSKMHPDGMRLSNWFLRRIEDKDTHGEVLCGKTGYVPQSGNCAASFAVDENGREYLCVTANAASTKQCLDDQAELYQKYLPAGGV